MLHLLHTRTARTTRSLKAQLSHNLRTADYAVFRRVSRDVASAGPCACDEDYYATAGDTGSCPILGTGLISHSEDMAESVAED